MDALDNFDAGITNLDLAWERINALGGSDLQNNSYDQGAVDTVTKALAIIEDLGGVDPAPKRAEWRQANSQFGVGA